jgi:hypothetical protein
LFVHLRESSFITKSLLFPKYWVLPTVLLKGLT